MKLGLIVCSAAAALGAMACGGNGRLVVGGCDPADPYCSPGPSGSGSSGGDWSYDSGVAVNEAGPGEASASDAGSTTDASDAGPVSTGDAGASSASSSSSGTGGTEASTGSGTCAPGNACGGLWECTDDCYTAKCCVLDCSCSDPSGATGTLDCALTCP